MVRNDDGYMNMQRRFAPVPRTRRMGAAPLIAGLVLDLMLALAGTSTPAASVDSATLPYVVKGDIDSEAANILDMIDEKRASIKTIHYRVKCDIVGRNSSITFETEHWIRVGKKERAVTRFPGRPQSVSVTDLTTRATTSREGNSPPKSLTMPMGMTDPLLGSPMDSAELRKRFKTEGKLLRREGDGEGERRLRFVEGVLAGNKLPNFEVLVDVQNRRCMGLDVLDKDNEIIASARTLSFQVVRGISLPRLIRQILYLPLGKHTITNTLTIYSLNEPISDDELSNVQ